MGIQGMTALLPLAFAVACGGQEPADAGKASNPIFEGWYADPQIRKFGNEYWVFPTVSDKFDEQTFFDAFSSSDIRPVGMSR